MKSFNFSVKVNCTKDLQSIRIYRTIDELPFMRAKRSHSLMRHVSDTTLFNTQKRIIRQAAVHGMFKLLFP